MTAFGHFVHTYAIWLYLLSALGILVGIKILSDAHRLARTTLFSLDQDRAGEQTFRGATLIVAFVFVIGAITAVNSLIYPASPSPEPPILSGATATFAALVFPSNTPTPSTTPTLIPATETPFYSPTPEVPTPRPVAKVTPARAAVPTSPAYPLAAPVLEYPPDGNVFIGLGQANAAITLKWNWDCTGCVLGPNDRFVVTIRYTAKQSGQPNVIGAGPRETSISLGTILKGYPYDVWQQAKEDTFSWFVQVKRGEQPVSPPSETWKFVWH